jgi:hypothetical protein
VSPTSLRHPTDVTDIFYAFIAEKKLNKHLNELVSELFNQNPIAFVEEKRPGLRTRNRRDGANRK